MQSTVFLVMSTWTPCLFVWSWVQHFWDTFCQHGKRPISLTAFLTRPASLPLSIFIRKPTWKFYHSTGCWWLFYPPKICPAQKSGMAKKDSIWRMCILHNNPAGSKSTQLLSPVACMFILNTRLIFIFKFNPVPDRLCQVIYNHGDKRYYCLVGIWLLMVYI